MSEVMSTDEGISAALNKIAGALPPYFVEQYERFLAGISITLSPRANETAVSRFLDIYSAHARQKTPEEAVTYAYAILEALGWEELDDLRRFVDRSVVIDTSMNEELERFQKLEDVYKVMGKLGLQLGDNQLSHYRLAVTVLQRVDADKSFVDIFTILRRKLTLYPLAVAFTIKVLERSGWGDTKKLKIFASPNFDLNEHYPVVDLCLTVADYYDNMYDKDFSTAKTFVSAVHLNDMNVRNYNRVDFTLLLLEQRVISVGDVSKIKDDARYPVFFKEYERRHKELLKKKYDQMKDEFRNLLFSVTSEALMTKSLDDVKIAWLELIQDKSKNEAEAVSNEIGRVKDEESLRALLQKYCFLSNISLLKCLARKLNVTESKERIDKLNDEYRKFSAKDLAIAEIEDHEMEEDHEEMTIVVSWNKSDVNLAKFQDELLKLFQDHSMFVSLRAVHQSWLTFVCTIPAWSVTLFTSIVAGAGVLIGVQQIIISNNVAYNDPDQNNLAVEPARDEPARKTMTELPYGRPLPLSEDIFPEKFDTKFESFTPALVEGIKVILMTATMTELRAVMGYLEPRDGRNKVVRTLVNDSFFYIGKYGEYPVAVAITAYGKSQQGLINVLQLLHNIKSSINPKYIIAIGICYGMDTSKMKPADIIVSEMVCDATVIRTGAQPHTRGANYRAGKILLGIFSTSEAGFEMKRDSVKVETGTLISRPDLVDDAKYKKQLREASNKPDALGGEMEGAGIMSFADDSKIEAIIIKAIGDWGDGDKAGMKGWKEFAAHAAARYVHFKMKEYPGVLT